MLNLHNHKVITSFFLYKRHTLVIPSLLNTISYISKQVHWITCNTFLLGYHCGTHSSTVSTRQYVFSGQSLSIESLFVLSQLSWKNNLEEKKNSSSNKVFLLVKRIRMSHNIHSLWEHGLLNHNTLKSETNVYPVPF